jgi:acetyl-CoA carboxylase / biotin carboxylase 1
MGLPTNTMADGHPKGANGTPSSNAAKYNLPAHFIGGNHLEVAPPGAVKDFVQNHGGHTVITNVRITKTMQPDSRTQLTVL